MLAAQAEIAATTAAASTPNVMARIDTALAEGTPCLRKAPASAQQAMGMATPGTREPDEPRSTDKLIHRVDVRSPPGGAKGGGGGGGSGGLGTKKMLLVLYVVAIHLLLLFSQMGGAHQRSTCEVSSTRSVRAGGARALPLAVNRTV